MQIKKFSVVAAMALCVAALPALSISQANAQDRMTAVNAPLALGGYCPVCIVKMQKWEKGDPAISSLYDGKTYLFPSAAVKAKFDAAPASFVPALGGDCIVCYEKMGKRVAGSLKHTSLFKGRLYLFPSEKELNLFLANPAPFVDTDLAINGECVVCLAKMGKHIAGSTQYTVIHNGLRYLFPSAKEADMFRQSPAQFVQTTTSMGKTGRWLLLRSESDRPSSSSCDSSGKVAARVVNTASARSVRRMNLGLRWKCAMAV